MCSVNFGQPYSDFDIYIFAVSTIIIEPIIFQINFDGIVLSSRSQQFTNFLNCVPNFIILGL